MQASAIGQLQLTRLFCDDDHQLGKTTISYGSETMYD